ncbi:MAG: amidohydrolase [Acidimicrobiales bacterium]
MGSGLPDAVVVNGRIYRVDRDFTTCEALAITGDRIVATGTTDEIRALAGDDTEVIDLEGRTVVPGFMDCHLHPVYSGKNLAQVQLEDCKSIADVLARVKERADTLPAGEWFRGSNHWTLDTLEERRLPYRSELDAVAPDNPFWVNVAFHRATANSPALAAAGIGADTPSNWGTGYVYKDPDTGEPNGHMAETPMFAIMQVERHETPEEILTGIDRVQDLSLANGITSVIDQGDVGPPFVGFRLLQDLWRRGALKLRWRVNHIGFEMAEMPTEQIASHIETLRVISGFGDSWLKFGAIGELVLDGFIEDAWDRAPYAEDVFGEGWCGIALFRPDTVMAIARAAAAHGLQMNVHCSGDAALDLALDTFEAVHRESPIDGLNWTLEHGGLAPSERNIRQCQQMGVWLSTQQPLQYWHNAGIRDFMGERAAEYFPNRTWLDHGIPLRGGSDFDTAPLSPLVGIWTAVARRTITGDVIAADQAIPREEALRMYTSNAAASVFEDDVKGSIEPGKLADLAILSADIMSVPDDDLAEIRVVASMVGGKVAYDEGLR